MIIYKVTDVFWDLHYHNNIFIHLFLKLYLLCCHLGQIWDFTCHVLVHSFVAFAFMFASWRAKYLMVIRIHFTLDQNYGLTV